VEDLPTALITLSTMSSLANSLTVNTVLISLNLSVDAYVDITLLFNPERKRVKRETGVRILSCLKVKNRPVLIHLRP
jgi:hypothetical protein